jgi:hypothetical protein
LVLSHRPTSPESPLPNNFYEQPGAAIGNLCSTAGWGARPDHFFEATAN